MLSLVGLDQWSLHHGHQDAGPEETSSIEKIGTMTRSPQKLM
jgi:hypothetical protein